MSKVTLSPLRDITDDFGRFSGYSVDKDGVAVDTSDCPFFFPEQPQGKTERLCKIYNDGGHYVATPYFKSYKKRKSDKTPFEKVFDLLYGEAFKSQRKWEKIHGHPRRPFNANAFVKKALPKLRARFSSQKVSEKMIRKMIKAKHEALKPEKKLSKTSAFDLAFDSLYLHALRSGLRGEEMASSIKKGLLKLYPDYPNLDEMIADKLEKKQRNLFSRKKRFRRKAYLNRWNYFVTITYDDKKHTAESFRKKLRKCLSNLHTRRGWRYMGVFEAAPDTGRLHFHGILYIPHGEMVGSIKALKDYSTAQGKVQITHSNDFFAESFGRNDFEELNAMELKRGNTLNYLLKYIGKTGERIVYSRGIATAIYRNVNDIDVVAKMQDFGEKFVLFDDVIDWERDIMRHTEYKQLNVLLYVDFLNRRRKTA